MTQTEALERFGKRTRPPQYKKVRGIAGPEHPTAGGTGELITALGQEAENAFEEQKVAARKKQRKRTKPVISDAS